MFKVYGDNYFKGWELVKTTDNINKANVIIENMDARIYRGFILVERSELLNQDVVVDRGTLDRPKELNKRRR